ICPKQEWFLVAACSPNLHGPITTGGGNALSVRRESHGKHCFRMTPNREQFIAFEGIPHAGRGDPIARDKPLAVRGKRNRADRADIGNPEQFSAGDRVPHLSRQKETASANPPAIRGKRN